MHNGLLVILLMTIHMWEKLNNLNKNHMKHAKFAYLMKQQIKQHIIIAYDPLCIRFV